MKSIRSVHGSEGVVGILLLLGIAIGQCIAMLFWPLKRLVRKQYRAALGGVFVVAITVTTIFIAPSADHILPTWSATLAGVAAYTFLGWATRD